MIPMHPAIAIPREVSSVDRLNAVPVSGPQLEAALEVLAALPAHLRARATAQAMALQAYAREAGFDADDAAAALHARVTALTKWTAAHYPSASPTPDRSSKQPPVSR